MVVFVVLDKVVKNDGVEVVILLGGGTQLVVVLATMLSLYRKMDVGAWIVCSEAQVAVLQIVLSL